MASAAGASRRDAAVAAEQAVTRGRLLPRRLADAAEPGDLLLVADGIENLHGQVGALAGSVVRYALTHLLLAPSNTEEPQVLAFALGLLLCSTLPFEELCVALLRFRASSSRRACSSR